jgi:hypothetical protein
MTPADGWNMFGMPRLDKSEYKRRANMLSFDLDLPDVLLMIIVEYGTTVMCTLSVFRNDIPPSFCFDNIKTSIVTPKRFHRIKNIQILASVLTIYDGHFDLLSNRMWYKRASKILNIDLDMFYAIHGCVDIVNKYPCDSYLILDKSDNIVDEWRQDANLRFCAMHHRNMFNAKIDVVESKF